MFSFFKLTIKDKLNALNITEELADKSTLALLRSGFKILLQRYFNVQLFLTETLIKYLDIRITLNFSNSINRPVLTFVISPN